MCFYFFLTNVYNTFFILEEMSEIFLKMNIRLNPLNAELNPICHLLTLLGAHHILHVSRIRVNVKYPSYLSDLNETPFLWIVFFP